jgi:hypothetical protein
MYQRRPVRLVEFAQESLDLVVAGNVRHDGDVDDSHSVGAAPGRLVGEGLRVFRFSAEIDDPGDPAPLKARKVLRSWLARAVQQPWADRVRPVVVFLVL